MSIVGLVGFYFLVIAICFVTNFFGFLERFVATPKVVALLGICGATVYVLFPEKAEGLYGLFWSNVDACTKGFARLVRRVS